MITCRFLFCLSHIQRWHYIDPAAQCEYDAAAPGRPIRIRPTSMVVSCFVNVFLECVIELLSLI